MREVEVYTLPKLAHYRTCRLLFTKYVTVHKIGQFLAIFVTVPQSFIIEMSPYNAVDCSV